MSLCFPRLCSPCMDFEDPSLTPICYLCGKGDPGRRCERGAETETELAPSIPEPPACTGSWMRQGPEEGGSPAGTLMVNCEGFYCFKSLHLGYWLQLCQP